MSNKWFYLLAFCFMSATVTSCSKDDDAPPIAPPSDGNIQILNGGEGGPSAVNSVYLDLSTDIQTSVARSSWDLGFYDGDLFRVSINNGNGASAVAVDKTDINAVSLADIDADTLQIKLGEGDGSLKVIDDPVAADITKTAIAEISATDESNKVYVFNPAGGSHSIPFDETNLWKLRILRKGDGYTLQYAKLSETTFKTLEITKDAKFNFKMVSLSDGAVVPGEPERTAWDIKWGWSMYYINMGFITPYSFSDLIFINHLGGVQAAEVLTSSVSYAAYTDTSIANTTFSGSYDVIGSKWRSTQPATGATTDRFYVIKDAAGNIYKLKFNSMGAGDAGVRGKPELEYKLVKQG